MFAETGIVTVVARGGVGEALLAGSVPDPNAEDGEVLPLSTPPADATVAADDDPGWKQAG